LKSRDELGRQQSGVSSRPGLKQQQQHFHSF
jgi:hypothetical protein